MDLHCGSSSGAVSAGRAATSPISMPSSPYSAKADMQRSPSYVLASKSRYAEAEVSYAGWSPSIALVRGRQEI